MNAEGYTSAWVCGRCHEDIYKLWKNSLHAFSLDDPIFDTAYMQAVKVAGDEAKRLCLRCHAPMTQVNGDFGLTEGVTREGVSCDFCHTVTAVHLDRPEAPYSVSPGLVKRSVIKEAESPAHQVAYSELHATSEFCAGCHTLAAANGTLLMGTYDEWRRGPYAQEGVQCQSCHMVLSSGNVVDQSIKKTPAGIHLHSLIHDTDQLKGALAVRVVGARRTARGLEVDVEIENVGSGHMIPTGLPTREIVLSVVAEVGGRTFEEQRRYRKIVADEDYEVLSTDYEVLLRGFRILSDNRIAPREKRHERFQFRGAPHEGAVQVTAMATYVYGPLVLHRQELKIRLSEAKRTFH